MSYDLHNHAFDGCELELSEYNPNAGYLRDQTGDSARDNLYTLLFPFENLGDQLDSEIMPLRVQWALDKGDDELDPASESWQRFKHLYGMQFGESKTVALVAPELSYTGATATETGKVPYDLGRYLRVVYLYVQPGVEPEFEDFVHKYIVPAADKILAYRDQVTNAPPLNKRRYFRFGAYWRKLSMNVNMPTVPEFELFVQKHLVRAARETDTPMLTYRTVTGDRHNYHMFFPFNEPQQIHNDRRNLMVASLLKKHQLQSFAEIAHTSLGPRHIARETAISHAEDLSAAFHSHLLDLEEIVYRTRPDMSSKLSGRYTPESIATVQRAYERGTLPNRNSTTLDL